MKGYKWLVDGLERLELWISTFLLGVLILLVLLEVVSRYLLNRPFPWVLELSTVPHHLYYLHRGSGHVQRKIPCHHRICF